MLRNPFVRASANSHSIESVEAHATGTVLGDPVAAPNGTLPETPSI
jgi:acyl transferase domain-containing protein